MQRLRRNVDHAATLRIPPCHLGVLDAQEDEDEQRHQHEDGRARAELAVKDAGYVIDGSADVGEYDGPAQERAEVASA